MKLGTSLPAARRSLRKEKESTDVEITISQSPTVVAQLAKDFDEPQTLSEVLSERGKRYGLFQYHGIIAQNLKNEMRVWPNWKHLEGDQAECLDMVQHKIARILNGDPNYVDSWQDIAGYAQLVANRLSKKD